MLLNLLLLLQDQAADAAVVAKNMNSLLGAVSVSGLRSSAPGSAWGASAGPPRRVSRGSQKRLATSAPQR